MPKRTDIKKILVLGAGPITIGQACEFDYSGTQACKSLREEGFQVVLINSNPATIMTDPEVADRTYVEPVTAEVARAVIEKERPDAILPTMGGQTALNVAVQLAESGFLDEMNVIMVGAKLDAIKLAEDRDLFKRKMIEIELDVPNSGIARNIQESRQIASEIGFPIIVRPAFTLGGIGGGIAYNQEELDEIALSGLNASPVREILLEESVLGWKEIELEVMRDCADNVIIVCSIENFDPMGVHTGDSITVAPVQTLSDKEYQTLRDAAIRVIRAVGVDTGGSNIQFGINPKTGRTVVIEMNPRVSRSSALASKATGYPIAKIAAKLAVGLTLDEIANDITRNTPASFEPALDYVVTKIPRFNFEKFRGADTTLTTQMRSVGEVMAIGRTFQESVQKALRGLELGISGFAAVPQRSRADFWEWRSRLSKPSPHRITDIFGAFEAGISVEEIHDLSAIDPWFLHNLHELYQLRASLKEDCESLEELDEKTLFELKRRGFSDRQLADCLEVSEKEVEDRRRALGIEPAYKIVDTCAAEFQAFTPYLYSTYEKETEVEPSEKPRVMILGGGPNRIGQGIEFDYCCVHASLALRELGYDSIMVNSNPETVSTDYDVSDRLYFEPLTLEDVVNIARVEKPEGIIVQLGGQTPLKLARGLESHGIKILGTPTDSIDMAEDRERFGAMVTRLGLRQPRGAIARNEKEARQAASDVGYPVLVRPSYVLGGQAMQIIYNADDLDHWLERGFHSGKEMSILIDQFLENAIEIDVDAISDGRATIIAGIMEHVEQAGVHSGDSTCVLPTQTIPLKVIEQIRVATQQIAKELSVKGLMNIQFALKDEELFVLEVNPRASRTIPFVSKATGVPWAKMAAGVMVGKSLSQLGLSPRHIPPHVAVKSVVIPFDRFPGAEISLGPEMRSTGEVMGIASRFDLAFAKAQVATGQSLPLEGGVFVSVTDKYKQEVVPIAQSLYQLGFKLIATRGTAATISSAGIPVQLTNKVSEGRPNLVDQIKNNQIQLCINIPSGRTARGDDQIIRRTAINYGIPVVTTLAGARAVASAIAAMQTGAIEVKSLQEYHKNISYWESASRTKSAPYSGI
ncbi:MAG: carbamoyl-phosphate synthase large subunit [Candidatus Melainabacteria bacterium]|nr:carbamoyl-phosphate synthase large subunit [Candidatus Melainabacteria bacterium]